MYKAIIIGAAASMALTASAFAAEGWGINHEKETRVEAKVVDLLCEVTGNCVPNCGGGKRQLGLLFDNGKLVPVVKNKRPLCRAIADLMPFCGKKIVADGLLISNPKMSLFQLQFKRARRRDSRRASGAGPTGSPRIGPRLIPGKKATNGFATTSVSKELIAKDGVLGIPGLKPPQ